MQVVVETIRNERLLPLTIGVYGGWGSGKSSLVGMVRDELVKEEGVVCVTFNGWLFESYEDAKSALMSTILDEIRSRQNLTEDTRNLLGKLAARVDWFRVMALAGKGALTFALSSVPGTAAAANLTIAGAKALASQPARSKPDEKTGGLSDETLQKVIRDDVQEPVHAIRAFRDDFVKLLESAKIRTLVVFIDELDRCLPETVVQTLEAIRLFLFAERTAFVIGADERLVQHAVRRRFTLEGMDPQIGAEYLEKMIQIPFRIPPMGPREIHTYMNLLFADLHCEPDGFKELVTQLPARARDHFGEMRFTYEDARELLDPVPPELAESFALTEQLAGTLTRGLSGNPRQTKRFLNALLLRMRLAELRGISLQRRVLSKLMLLEYFRPEHFRILAAWQGRQAGLPEELPVLEQSLDAEKVPAPPTPDKGAAPRKGAARVRAAEENPSGDAQQARVPPHAKDWLEDTWLKSWLGLEPTLADIDLRPYFYVAREKIGHTEGALLQLSPSATEALRKLRSTSEALRSAGHISL
ncbi:MAG TPA: P-loop NTPase fold protein [Longimicrobium sp.]